MFATKKSPTTDKEPAIAENKINAWITDHLTRIPMVLKMLFIYHLKTMIKAGLPIVNALQVLGQEIENKRLKKVIGQIKEGVEKVRSEGVPVDCVIEYDEVLDEVCQRDFWGGVPLSGRTVISDKGETWSAPYFRPFGFPEKWASIPPENVEAFSAFCFLKTVELWREVEKVNGALLPVTEVPRSLKGIEEKNSIVDALMNFMVTSR